MNQEQQVQIVLDIETTGFSPFLYSEQHRIVEIGCVKLVDFKENGETYHCYINPQKWLDNENTKIHGLTNEFLDEQKTFEEIADEFLNFIKNYPLVIHNANFDMSFIQHHLKQIGKKELQNEVVDTLKLARQLFPKQSLKLQKLCENFGVDTSARVFHGALLDAQLLSQVYFNLLKLYKEQSTQYSNSQANNNAIGGVNKKIRKPNKKTQKCTQKKYSMNETTNFEFYIKNPTFNLFSYQNTQENQQNQIIENNKKISQTLNSQQKSSLLSRQDTQKIYGRFSSCNSNSNSQLSEFNSIQSTSQNESNDFNDKLKSPSLVLQNKINYQNDQNDNTEEIIDIDLDLVDQLLDQYYLQQQNSQNKQDPSNQNMHNQNKVTEPNQILDQNLDIKESIFNL